MKRLIVPALLALLCSCGPTNAQYFHISIAPFSASTGTNCGSATLIQTWTGVEGSDNWTVYPAPSNQYLLDGIQSITGAPLILTGTLSGGTYSFSGNTTTVTTPGHDTITNETAYTISLTASGPGVTGTISEVTSCNSSSGTGCSGSGGNDSSCTQSASLQGTLLSNVTTFNEPGAAVSTLGQ